MNLNRFRARRWPWLVLVILSLAIDASAASRKEQVLYSFQGLPDGAVPAGGVVFDSQGNLYGATTDGGANNCPGIAQCGTVYQLAPPTQQGGSWTESILYVFQGKNVDDGETPAGGVLIDTAGNLYGTTAYGGAGSCVLLGNKVGCGTVYKLSPPTQKGGAWTETILHSFQGGKDGYLPWGDLVFDKQGNLYGATEFGGGKGTSCNTLYQYCGTVFKLTAPKQKGGKWTEKVLHSFAGGTSGKSSGDGAEPNGGLIVDSRGAVYGTTFYGGNETGECNGGVGGIGCGTVFKLTPPSKKGYNWVERVLYRFDGQNGATPVAGVTFDSGGNIYGSAYAGGDGGNGVIFEVAKPRGSSRTWSEKVLHRFSGGTDGGGPESAVSFNVHGDLFGTANFGSTNAGNVFELKPLSGTMQSWRFNILYGFNGPPDGALPAAPVVLGQTMFFGTTTEGGSGTECRYGCGSVFELKP